jgi:hypothetical protein
MSKVIFSRRRLLNQLYQDFHFAFPATSQHRPNRLRWDHFFNVFIPNDTSGPRRGQPCLFPVRENQRLPHFHAISQTLLPSLTSLLMDFFACRAVSARQTLDLEKLTASKATFRRTDTVACAIIRRANKCPRPKPLQETSGYASERNMTLGVLTHSRVNGFFSTPSTLRTKAMTRYSSSAVIGLSPMGWEK